jgi:hypothetical protein
MDDPDLAMLLPDLDAMGMVERHRGVERLLVGLGFKFLDAQELPHAVAEI